jgi:hypothetical protein
LLPHLEQGLCHQLLLLLLLLVQQSPLLLLLFLQCQLPLQGCLRVPATSSAWSALCCPAPSCSEAAEAPCCCHPLLLLLAGFAAAAAAQLDPSRPCLPTALEMLLLLLVMRKLL